MRDVAIVSFAQAKAKRRELDANEVEILMPVVSEALERSGIPRREIGFTCSGSSDYLAGHPFAFVTADNGSISRIVVSGNRWIIRGFNDTAHLEAPPTGEPAG